MLGNFSWFFCRLLIFFKINFLEKFFQEQYKSVKQFGSRSGPTLCWSWSGSKLFSKVISRRQVATSMGRVKGVSYYFSSAAGLIDTLRVASIKHSDINSRSLEYYTLNLPNIVSSADNFCKQFGVRSGPTFCRSWSRPNCFTFWWYCWRIFQKSLLWKNSADDKKFEKAELIQCV